MHYGKIMVVPGENGSRFPFNSSILIVDEVCTIVDPGAGKKTILDLKSRFNIELVLNTHYHFDHIAYNYMFPEARLLINEIDSPCFVDKKELARRLGMVDCFGEEWTDGWLERIKEPNTAQSPYSPQNRHEWWLSTARLDGTYQWGDTFDFGTTKMTVVGAPGHTGGFSCFYFPEQGLVYTGDIDLTAFGPWYAGRDSDIDAFINSARNLGELDADAFVTGHELGTLTKKEFKQKLELYLGIIDHRDELILSALSIPHTLHELTELGMFYGRRFLVDDWIMAWEQMQVRKHLERLLRQGMIKQAEETFFR
ncbi:MAG: MBL fold metallo-hydrolase [Bacillota bacterium]